MAPTSSNSPRRWEGNRPQLFEEFRDFCWDGSPGVHPEWQVPRPSTRDWISFPGGYRPIAYWSVSSAQAQRLRSELYLPGAEDADVQSRELHAVADQVNMAYGSALSWEPLPGKKASRVADYGAGEIMHRAARFIVSQERLRKTIKSVERLVGWLSPG